jgi:UDP-N-acetylglucosamine--dolichyl-phosphate N-acetylglucosaminephosphotransferase
MSEKQVGFQIFKLAIFSGILAIISAMLMGISL